MPLLDIRQLQIRFGPHRAVDEVSITLDPGETLGLVGESGCGKSITALSIARLLPSPPASYPGGQILVDGRDTLRMNARDLRSVRGRLVSHVFQEPGASLNPVMRIGAQIEESLRHHRSGAGPAKVVELLRRVGIPAPDLRARDYPHQLSGGMQQRVALAMALAAEPRLLIADEPTTALDVTIQAQILDLLRALQRQSGLGMLLITHNLGIVADVADRIAVMYAGEIVEEGPAGAVLAAPEHPYTRALVAAVPEPGRSATRLRTLPGSVPTPGHWPEGCRFAPRCEFARDSCHHQHPALQPRTDVGTVRCPYAAALTPAPGHSSSPHGPA